MKKSFITGFICGGIICAAVTGLAVEYAVTANPYPVKVNGVETAIEGYNINDETYFKLRDVSAAVGGFVVDFKDNAITIDTPQETVQMPAPINTSAEQLPDVPVKTVNSVEYVDMIDIENMLQSIGLGNYKFAGNEFYNDNDSLNSLLTDIPLCERDSLLIPLEYYNSTIVPLINSLK